MLEVGILTTIEWIVLLGFCFCVIVSYLWIIFHPEPELKYKKHDTDSQLSEVYSINEIRAIHGYQENQESESNMGRFMKAKFIKDEKDVRFLCNRLGFDYSEDARDICIDHYYVAPFGDDAGNWYSIVDPGTFHNGFVMGEELNNGFRECRAKEIVPIEE